MNLIAYARIACKKVPINEKEDKQQDCILHILEKGIQDMPKSYIIKAMKNKLIDDLRKSRKITKDVVASEQLYGGAFIDDRPSSNTDFFEEVSSDGGYWELDLTIFSPRDHIFFITCIDEGLTYVAFSLNEKYNRVRDRFLSLKRKIQKIYNA